MDRRTTLAIILCFMIFFGWQKFYLEPRLPKANTMQVQATNTASVNQDQSSGGSTSSSGNSLQGGSKPTAPNTPLETKKISLETGVATISNGNHVFTDWNLKSYRLDIAPEAAAVDLKSVTHQDGQVELAFDQQELAYLGNVRGNLSTTSNSANWSYEDANVKLTRELVTSENEPYIDLKFNADFKGSIKPKYAFISLNLQADEKDPEIRDRNLIYWTNQSIERMSVKDASALKEIATPVKWIGATSRYFVMALVSTGFDPRALIQPAGQGSGRISMVYPVNGNSISIPIRAYFGPKELDVLRRVDPTLDHTVDFGWFTLFAYPLLKIMKGFYTFVHNWGVAIILLTLLVKVLTFPLTYKSMKSMKRMAKLQPQLARLKEKYKDNKEQLNREMLTMMRSEGYNPAAGCLPMLIQMPVFFALYRVLYSSIELYHAPFAFWIHDLSSKDPFYVTPILLSISMFAQQKLTPNTAADPAQQKMMQFMPIMFGAFMISLPSGLTLYMLVNALSSIVQQLILNKKLDTGNVTAAPARAR